MRTAVRTPVPSSSEVAAPLPGRAARWRAELALGVQLSVAGGRSSWTRLAMIAIGVGLGVAMLLVAATIPTLVAARDARLAARAPDRTDQPLAPGPDTLLIAEADSRYRDIVIQGWLLQPEGDRAPLPPGVTQRPAPGEMVVSPALARLLAEDEGALLRDRWEARVVGTIGADGLAGSGEHAFYLGTDRLTVDDATGGATRIRSFGSTPGLDAAAPAVLLLGVVGLVVVLLPVVVFLAAAVRFGGEARDRQLAALRLLGANAATTRRIAAGEALAGALLGLVAGGLLFLAVGLLASRSVPAGLGADLAGLRPVPALAALVVVLVPGVAVLVALSALRRVVLDPLGVVRRSGDRRRRLWWRLLLPAAGLALLHPLHDGLRAGQDVGYQVPAGVATLLVGVALLLPWLVEATVRRLGGGGVAWELAVRRLQLDSGTAVRAVSGIAVSVAGAIALQGLLAAVQAQYAAESQRDTSRFQAEMWSLPGPAQRWTAAVVQTPGVRAAGLVTTVSVPRANGEPDALLMIGDCGVLREFATLDTCTDGDTFVVVADPAAALPHGRTYPLRRPTAGDADPARTWTLPVTARAVPPAADGELSPALPPTAVLITPGALGGSRPDESWFELHVALDPADPDAVERLRNTAAEVDPRAQVTLVGTRPLDATLAAVGQGLFIGAVALLLLIGASMLVGIAEQLRERRRALAVLVAFGTRRSTLGQSVLIQVAVPVVLGTALAVVTGTALAAILQAAAGAPVRIDWAGIGATAGAAALVVLLTTAAGLPLLWRLTGPGGLRSE